MHTTQSYNDVAFDLFGIYGANFQTSLGSIEEIVDTPYPNGRQLYWSLVCYRIMREQLFLPSYMSDIWKIIQKAHKPLKFHSWQKIFSKDEINKLDNYEMAVNLASLLYSESLSRYNLKPVTYGTLLNAHITYLKMHSQRILDFGCGSGYIAKTLGDHGIDVLGYDSETYVEHKRIIFNFLPDEQRIGTEAEALIELAEDRDLFISWPQPNASYPVEILKRYREIGGRRFIFIPGSYGSLYDNDDFNFKMDVAAANYSELLIELFSYWKPVHYEVPFYPLYGGKNMFIFER